MFCFCGNSNGSRNSFSAQKLTIERLNCPECGTHKEGILVYNDVGQNMKGEIQQKDGRMIGYRRKRNEKKLKTCF